VPPPLTELKLFLWDNPDKDQWASIYIAGQYPAYTDDTGKEVRPARSKNVIQEKIMSALNWQGSPMQLLLEEGDLAELDDTDAVELEDESPTPPKQKPVTKKAAVAAKASGADDDPLADLDGGDIPY